MLAFDSAVHVWVWTNFAASKRLNTRFRNKEGTDKWSFYAGQWHQHTKQGEGALAAATPPATLRLSSWRLQLMNAGNMKFHDGRSYSGWWHSNKMAGPGVMVHPDGRRQEGMWKDDKFEGKMQPGPADPSNTKPRPKWSHRFYSRHLAKFEYRHSLARWTLMNSKVIKIKNLFVARSHSICSSSFIVGVTANANCCVIMGVVELMTANALQTVAGVTIKRRPLAMCNVMCWRVWPSFSASDGDDQTWNQKPVISITPDS
jgi:hypothetical protein